MSIRFPRCAWILIALLCSVHGCKPSERPLPITSVEAPEEDRRIDEELKRGRLLLAGGNPEAANQIAEELLQLDPLNGQALVLSGQSVVAMDDGERGVELLDQAARQLPEQWVELNTQIAGLLWQQNRLQEASIRFADLLTAHPEFDEARRGLAMLQNQLGHRFDANQNIRILSQRPNLLLTESELLTLLFPRRTEPELIELPALDDTEAIKTVGALNLVRALAARGDMMGALIVLRDSDLLGSGNPVAMVLLGQVLAESEQIDELEKWIRQIVAVESRRNECKTYPEYWQAVGHWALHRNQPRQAVHLFAEAIRREPNDVAVYDHIIRALEASSETEAASRLSQRRGQIQAITDLAETIRRQADVPEDSYQRIATMLSNVGRPLEAHGWRMLERLRSSPSDEVMSRSNIELAKLLNSEVLANSARVLLCDLNPALFPLDLPSLLPDSTSQPSAPTQW